MTPKTRMKRAPRTIDPFVPESTLLKLTINGVDINTFMNPVPLEGFGPDIVVAFYQGGKCRLLIPLCDWTADELELFKSLMDQTLALAMPLAKARDEKAVEYSRDKHVLMRRLTRAIPNLITSKRLVGIDVQELLRRPVDVPDDDGNDEDK